MSNGDSFCSSPASTTPLLRSKENGCKPLITAASQPLDNQGYATPRAGLEGPPPVRCNDRASYCKSHDYEELPSVGYDYNYGYKVPAGTSGSDDPHPPLRNVSSAVSIATPSLLLTGYSQSNLGPGYRKRLNPLYATMKHQQRDYEPKTWHICRNLLVPTICVLAVLMNVATCCVFFSLLKNGYFSDASAEAKGRLSHLESQLNFVMNVLNYSNDSGSEVRMLRDQMFAGVRLEFHEELNSLNAQLGEQILNVSKMPGPPGRPGAGNLTQCKHGTRVNDSPSDSPENFSPWYPTDQADVKDWQITGVACTTDGGTQALLFSKQFLNDTKMQYRCECHGKKSKLIRSCYLHYWVCPMVS